MNALLHHLPPFSIPWDASSVHISSQSMDLDVIDATAEALPLEMLNRTNKELTAQLSRCEQQLEEKTKGIEDQRKRLQFMKEHLANVRAEIVNTQSLAESKRREVESEESMCRIISREVGRLQQRKSQLVRKQDEVQDQMTSVQNQIFQGNLKMEELKTAMDFNQEELEQWDEARRQKEEDELAIAQYTKQDETKLRQLTMQAERLGTQVRERRTQLDDELLSAQTVQGELDHLAAEYRKLHDDRSGILEEWERVVRAIAERDDSIRLAAEQYAKGVEWLVRREAVRKDLSDQWEAACEEKEGINGIIQEREKSAQKLRDAVPILTKQVRDLDDETEAMREQVQATTKARNNAHVRLQQALEDIDRKRKELVGTEQRRERVKQQLAEEIAAAEDLGKQSALIAKLLTDAQRTSQNIERDVESLKKDVVQASQQLHDVREDQMNRFSEIKGSQATGKNLNAKIGQLDGESFAQQGILYNVEFSVQQMEKKVNRAKGELSEDERKELQDKISLLQATLEELESQHRQLDTQAKRVSEELRQSKVAMEKMELEKKRTVDRVVDITLECAHSESDVKKLEKQQEDALIQVDTLELQLNRLKRQLRVKSGEMATFEERKRQLEADIIERETEIGVHHGLLKMEGKLSEDERKRLANELQDRLKTLKGIRSRHEVLVGKMDPSQTRLSQAQLVIKAAKERESLQTRGDSLDSKIKSVERDMLKLEKTIAILKASNYSYRHKFDKVSEESEEVRMQRVLQEKFRELKALMNRRAVDTNNYHATLEAKRGELDHLAMERERLRVTMHDLQQEYDNATQEILQSREELVRYDQAVGRAKALVDATISTDVELAETRDRLQKVVTRLLQCSQQAGDKVYDAVKQMIVASDLPIGPIDPNF